MTETSVHIFRGDFGGVENARRYTQESWQPEPPETATDEEYSEWENNNPRWAMRDDLGLSLDSDFIETIESEGAVDYLKTMLAPQVVDDELASHITAPADTLVLIFREAISGDDAAVESCGPLSYLGQFACKL